MEHCDGNGILGLFDGVPVTCACQVGQNAKKANPDWLTQEEFQAKCKKLGIEFHPGGKHDS